MYRMRPIRIERKILEMSVPGAEVEIQEYMVACYGTTEYPEDMSGIILKCEGKEADLFTILESLGVNAVRLRVFVNPPKEAFWMKHEDD